MKCAAVAVGALLSVPFGLLGCGDGAPSATKARERAIAAAPHPRRYAVARVPPGAAPAIDGALADPAWNAAPWSERFVDIVGGSDTPVPPHATRFKALWDDERLYVAAELEEPLLFATIREHDAVIFRDPDFELFVDPEGDRRHYVELEVNALGTTWDLRLDRPYSESGKPDDAFELAGLALAVGLDGTLDDPTDVDRGWTVELSVPWSSFAAPGTTLGPPAPGTSWRVNFSRVEWPLDVASGQASIPPGAKEANRVWSPQGVVDMHRPERWGFFDFRP